MNQFPNRKIQWVSVLHTQLNQLVESLTYEKKMFVRLMALVTLPMAVMGILSALLYARSESARNTITLHFYTDEIRREYENVFTSVREQYLEFVNTEQFRWMLRQDEAPYTQLSEIKEAQSELLGSYLTSRYIQGYEFINLSGGWVLNNYGMFDWKNLENKQETIQFLKEQSEVPLDIYWKNTDYTAPIMGKNLRKSNTVDNSGLRLILKGGKSELGPAWILSAKINLMELSNLLDGYENLGYQISIMSGSEALLEKSWALSQTYLKYASMGPGVYPAVNGGAKLGLDWLSSDSSGLTYVVGYDSGKIWKYASIFLLTAAAVVAGFGVLMLLVRMTVVYAATPLKRLESFVDNQNNQIRELFLSNLLKGEISEERIGASLANLNVTPRKAYRMVGLVKKGNLVEGHNKEAYEQVIAAMPQEMKSQIFIMPLYYREKLILIVGAEDELDADNQTAALYKEVKDFMEERFSCAVAFGISSTFHSLSQAHRAYDECSEALCDPSRHKSTKEASLALFDDYLMMRQETNVYDIIVERELLSAIEKGSEEYSISLLRMIIERVEAKEVVGVERTFYLMRLLTGILNIPVNAGIPLSEIFDGEQYNLVNQITQIFDRERLIEQIEAKLIRPIIERFSQQKRGEDDRELIKELKTLIKENQGNITLNECAQQLNYHPNYLSKVLQKSKGTTFTDMVAEEKLVQAKYLLLTTTLSVAEIAEKLQYNNAQNFIRFFKKHVDVTPAAFRKEHKKPQE